MKDQTPKNPKALVRAGYDRVSAVYRGDQPTEDGVVYARYGEWIGELASQIPGGAPVLDLGCGNGIPECRMLVDAGFAVTGVDLSPVQVRRARRLVPEGTFICGDMNGVDFSPASFNAVVSLYAVIHVPLAEQPALFAKIHTWLKPGGYLLVIVGAEAWTGMETNWLGVDGADMYWSHADKDTYLQWLHDCGFNVLQSPFIAEGDGGHVLILAQRP